MAKAAEKTPDVAIETTNANASESEQPAVWRAPNTLVPWTKNPKPLEPKDVREMVRSIRRFGFGAPIVIRAANSEIIEGHLRQAAALRLGLQRVPVRVLDLPEDEAHMLALAAWKFEHRREAKDDEIAIILDELEERGVDLELGTGFADGEIDKLIAAHDEKTAGENGSEVRAHRRRKPGPSTLTYQILITCKSDEHQAELLETLEATGLECKPLMV